MSDTWFFFIFLIVIPFAVGILYTALTAEKYYCLYCSFDMTNTGVCVDCNEYKSAVTLEHFIEMNGYHPKTGAIK